MKRDAVANLWARVALLAAAGVLEGVLLANGPILQEYSAVRLGPRGIFVDIILLCALALGALGAVAAFTPWTKATFLAVVVASASWSLAGPSLHPWWILDAGFTWETKPLAAADAVGHGAALALVGAAVILQSLQRYRAKAEEQGIAPADIRRDTRRMGSAAFTALGVLAVVALPLPILLDGLASKLQGAIRGPASFTLLLLSAVLLLAGFGVLARQGKKAKRQAGSEKASAISSGGGET